MFKIIIEPDRMRPRERGNESDLITDKEYKIVVGVFGIFLIILMTYCLIVLLSRFRG